MVKSKSRHSRARKKSQRRTCKPGRKDAESLMREAEAEEGASLSAAFEPVSVLKLLPHTLGVSIWLEI